MSKERFFLTERSGITLRSSQERGKEKPIFTSVRPGAPEGFETGATPGAGTFCCIRCGSHLSLIESDELPLCPDCGSEGFRRDSIFEAMQEQPSGRTSEFSAAPRPRRPAWIHEARTMLRGPGHHLAYLEDDETIRVFPIERGWTRIGRSSSADIRLDDPSVSRRHALVVSELPKTLRVLDDRSLNGVHVNGERIEWARLGDGDELAVGRYRLYALEA
jgi:predicted  nucleic acid-binding Zn-ribbon protein